MSSRGVEGVFTIIFLAISSAYFIPVMFGQGMFIYEPQGTLVDDIQIIRIIIMIGVMFMLFAILSHYVRE